MSRTIQIWRVADHTLVCTLYGHYDRVTGVAFSPDGQWIASVAQDGTARLWNIKEKKTIGKLEGTGFTESDYGNVRFSDDGTSITVVSGKKSSSWELVSQNEPSSPDHVKFLFTFTPHDQVFENQSSLLYRRVSRSEWISNQDGIRVCWLPQDLRNITSFHCQGSKVAAGKLLVAGGSFGLISARRSQIIEKFSHATSIIILSSAVLSVISLQFRTHSYCMIT